MNESKLRAALEGLIAKFCTQYRLAGIKPLKDSMNPAEELLFRAEEALAASQPATEAGDVERAKRLAHNVLDIAEFECDGRINGGKGWSPEREAIIAKMIAAEFAAIRAEAQPTKGESNEHNRAMDSNANDTCVGQSSDDNRASKSHDSSGEVGSVAQPASQPEGSALDEGAPVNAAYRIWNDLTEFIAFLGPHDNKYKAIAVIQGRIVEMLNNEGVNCASQPRVAQREGEGKVCSSCHHDLKDNSHGFDQNDAEMDGDELVHCGRCTYCKWCNPRLLAQREKGDSE